VTNAGQLISVAGSAAEIDVIVVELIGLWFAGFLGFAGVALARTLFIPLVGFVEFVGAFDMRLERIGGRGGVAAGQLRSANLLLPGISRLLLRHGAAENRASQGIEFGHGTTHSAAGEAV